MRYILVVHVDNMSFGDFSFMAQKEEPFTQDDVYEILKASYKDIKLFSKDIHGDMEKLNKQLEVL